MTYDEIREYVRERGDASYDGYLIQAIAAHCPDPSTRDLIDFWYASVEGVEDSDPDRVDYWSKYLSSEDD